MKHVAETMMQFKEDLFFKAINESKVVIEEVQEEMTPEEKEKIAKELEKQGLGVVKKIGANFSIFKSIALDDWKQYRDFWNARNSEKEAQGVIDGIFYKLYDSKYLAGITKEDDGTAKMTVWNVEIEDGYDDHIVFETKSAEVIKSFMDFYKNTFEKEMREIISKEKEKLEQKKAEAVKQQKEEEKTKAKEKLNAFMTESVEESQLDALKDYFKNAWSRDNTLRKIILANDHLWEKYKKYLDANMNWDELDIDELIYLWDEWEKDSEDFKMNESKKTAQKKGPKPLTVPETPKKTKPTAKPKKKK